MSLLDGAKNQSILFLNFRCKMLASLCSFLKHWGFNMNPHYHCREKNATQKEEEEGEIRFTNSISAFKSLLQNHFHKPAFNSLINVSVYLLCCVYRALLIICRILQCDCLCYLFCGAFVLLYCHFICSDALCKHVRNVREN